MNCIVQYYAYTTHIVLFSMNNENEERSKHQSMIN